MKQMESEILVIKKEDLLEILEGFSRRLTHQLGLFTGQSGSSSNMEKPKVKRLNSKKICQMLDISQSTFERMQHELPIHRSATGRVFAYEHDLIIYLFRKFPPHYDYTHFEEYVKQDNIVKFLSGKSV
jgi:hypothetical protein